MPEKVRPTHYEQIFVSVILGRRAEAVLVQVET